ncbi:MAG: CDP-alcohol phosphatidyltransferase family protein [Gemmatimonadales bacterium]|nr:CDP-alcohol phosphatidyltransferase family protein [Gemmatimonadales bacterium]
MFDHWLRMLKDRLFEPIAPAIGRWLHPNLISLLALLAGLAAALLAARGRTGPAFAAWVVNRTLDGLDGSVARAVGSQSDFGGYLDIMGDFVVYAAVPVGVVLGQPSESAWRAGLFLLATFFVNAASWMYLAAILERRSLGVAATGERTTITMPPAIVAGSETVVFYSLFLLLPAWAPPLFWLMGMLVVGNIVLRLAWAKGRI